MVDIKKVSFDFDSTLSLPIVQEYAKELISKGIEAWICTARFTNEEATNRWRANDWNKDLFSVAEEVGIPVEQIIFTNMDLKSDVIGKQNGFLWHLDDCTVEVNNLNLDGNIPAILMSKYTNWKQECNHILNSQSTLLWLDDYRDPFDLNKNWLQMYAPRWLDNIDDIVWVKNYDSFIEWIINNGLPNHIAFDHDLDEKHYAPREFWDDKYNDWLASQGNIEKTGMDCAKWLIEYCMDYNKELPMWVIQSANPAGAKNIRGLLTSYMKAHA